MRIACQYDAVDKQPACWRSWGSDSGVAEGSDLLGCEAVSLGEWILTCRKFVVPSKRRELLVQRDALQSRRNFPHDIVSMKQVRQC